MPVGGFGSLASSAMAPPSSGTIATPVPRARYTPVSSSVMQLGASREGARVTTGQRPVVHAAPPQLRAQKPQLFPSGDACAQTPLQHDPLPHVCSSGTSLHPVALVAGWQLWQVFAGFG